MAGGAVGRRNRQLLDGVEELAGDVDEPEELELDELSPCECEWPPCECECPWLSPPDDPLDESEPPDELELLELLELDEPPRLSFL